MEGSTNISKSDSDAATWLPPDRTYRCSYVARQVAVKVRYRLAVTASEQSAIARILSTCPGQAAPTEKGAPPPIPVPSRTSTPISTPISTPTPSSVPATTRATTSASPVPRVTSPVPAPPVTAVYYANCAAVRAAGKAPLHRGQPGYRSGLDRDGDGVACE